MTWTPAHQKYLDEYNKAHGLQYIERACRESQASDYLLAEDCPYKLNWYFISALALNFAIWAIIAWAFWRFI